VDPKKAVLKSEKGEASKKVNGSQKPNYGYVALKPFLGITIMGMIGLIVASAGFFIDWSLNWVLLLVGVPVAFVGLYIGASYIPMHYLLQNLGEKAPDFSCGDESPKSLFESRVYK